MYSKICIIPPVKCICSIRFQSCMHYHSFLIVHLLLWYVKLVQNICARKFRSATVTLLLSEDQCPMMMHIFANHSKYFCKQNLYSFVSEKYLLNRCKSIFVLEIWICHSYLVVIWGSVSTEASHVHLCWQRCRLNLYFVTLHSFPSFLTSEVSFLVNATT